MDDREPTQDDLFRERDDARQRVAELEASEAELRHQLARYRELVDNVNSVILRLDPQGNLTFINPFACSFFGYAEEEVLGKNIINTVVPEVDAAGRDMRAAMRDLCEHPERYRYNRNENLCRDGRRVWVSWTNKPIRDADGQLVEILCIGNDISDLKRTEDALRASEASCHEIIDASTDTIFLYDYKNDKVVDANRSVFDMYGYTQEEALHLTTWDLSPDDPPHTQEEADLLWQTVIAEGPQRLEWQTKRKNGDLFWCEAIFKHVVISGQDRILAIIRDITERKQAEQRIRQEQDMLRQLLDAQERERQLVAFEIHDGPAQLLAAAVMQIETFERLRDTDPEAAQQAFGLGQRTLIDGLAEIRRLIRGLRPVVLDESGVVAAIEDMVAEVNSQPGPNVEFSADVQFDRLPPELENSVFRIVQESLTNARRYSQSDSVTIRLAQKDGRLEIEVKDRGQGFHLDDIGRQCFGLTGIRERASLLGGRASIESQPGQGTRVWVELPLNRPQSS